MGYLRCVGLAITSSYRSGPFLYFSYEKTTILIKRNQANFLLTPQYYRVGLIDRVLVTVYDNVVELSENDLLCINHRAHSIPSMMLC